MKQCVKWIILEKDHNVNLVMGQLQTAKIVIQLQILQLSNAWDVCVVMFPHQMELLAMLVLRLWLDANNVKIQYFVADANLDIIWSKI